MPRRPPSPKQRVEYRFFYDAMRRFEWDLRHGIWYDGIVPRQWTELLNEDRRPRKVRVTIRLDEDVVRFFRGHWAEGYQPKINAVLRAFLKLKLSRLLEGPESLDVIARAETEAADGSRRPAYGDWEAFLARRDEGEG